MNTAGAFYRICSSCRTQLRNSQNLIPFTPIPTQTSRQARFLSITPSSSSSRPIDLPPPETEVITSEGAQNVPPQTTLSTSSSPISQQLNRPSTQHQPSPNDIFVATVSRTGTMDRTVQLTRQHQVWDKFLHKHYTRPHRVKAHVPNEYNFPGSIREGDIVTYGKFTAAEILEKEEKEEERIRRTVAHLIEKESEAARLEKRTDKGENGKGVRKFLREEREYKERSKGGAFKEKGVRWVIRSVVTPFGVGLDERAAAAASEGLAKGQQPSSKDGGQDSLAKSRKIHA